MQKTQSNTGTPWKISLALLVGGLILGTAASLFTAVRLRSPVVDTDYYNHGLHYDQTRSGAKNAGLSWTISASLAGDQLEVLVKDASGIPVDGGQLKFEPQQEGAGSRSSLALAEWAPGTFRVPRPLAPTGELRGILRFTRGDATASQKLILLN